MTSRGHLTSGTSFHRQIYVAAQVPTGPTLYSVVSGSGAKLKTRFLDDPAIIQSYSRHFVFPVNHSFERILLFKRSHHVLTLQPSSNPNEHSINKQSGRCASYFRLLNRLSPALRYPPPSPRKWRKEPSPDCPPNHHLSPTPCTPARRLSQYFGQSSSSIRWVSP